MSHDLIHKRFAYRNFQKLSYWSKSCFSTPVGAPEMKPSIILCFLLFSCPLSYIYIITKNFYKIKALYFSFALPTELPENICGLVIILCGSAPSMFFGPAFICLIGSPSVENPRAVPPSARPTLPLRVRLLRTFLMNEAPQNRSHLRDSNPHTLITNQ